MRSRLLLNLILLLAVLGLGAWYWLQSSQPQDSSTPPRISNIDMDSVQQLRVQRPDEPAIELARVEDDWQLQQPLAADAEDSRVESILLLLISSSESRFPAADKNLEQFGLEPPQLTIRFDNQSFVIGDSNPLNDEQRYVLHDGQVHLIDGRLYQRLNAPLNYYVNPSLTPPNSKLARIRLPDGLLRKQADDDWRIIPERLSDSPASVADSWQSARASYVKRHDNEASEYSPEVTLEFAEHESISYRVVATDPQIILARPDQGLQYHLPADMVTELLLVDPAATEDTDNE